MKYFLKNMDQQSATLLADFFVEKRELFPHILLLDGEIGTGKTTFTHEYITRGKSEINFSSPTYALVNEYHFTDRAVNHFDLYRITEDDYNWIFEYLEKEAEFFIFEWSVLHQELFEEREFIKIEFIYDTDLTRNLVVSLKEEFTDAIEEFFHEKGFVFEKCSKSNCN